MSIEDPELDARLREHARRWQADFAPPPLAGRLAEATAPRPSRNKLWLGSLVAAIVVLVIPLATVAGIHRWFAATPIGTTARLPYRVDTVPTSIVRDGQRLDKVAEVAWSSAVLAADGRGIVVSAAVDTVAGCGSPTTAGFLTGNDADRVSLTVAAYRPSPASSAGNQPCADVGHPPQPVSLTLDAALGGRQLADGSTGAVHPVLDARSVPQPSYLPPDFGAGTLRWDESGSPKQPVARNYGWAHSHPAAAGQSVSVERRSLPASPLYQQQVLDTGMVLGNPAVVAQTRNFPDLVCALWTDQDYSWRVCSSGSPTAELGAGELLKIANSLS
ncbi:MAG: hypothetical protein ACR2N4_01395 [Jatrophihabitans sp.]